MVSCFYAPLSDNAFVVPLLNFRYVPTKSFFSIVLLRTPPQAIDNISLIQYKPFKGGLPNPYYYPEKLQRSLRCKSGSQCGRFVS